MNGFRYFRRLVFLITFLCVFSVIAMDCVK